MRTVPARSATAVKATRVPRGAFTTHSRELSTNESEVLKLTSDPEARIEVRGADATTLHHEQHQPEEEREAEPAIS